MSIWLLPWCLLWEKGRSWMIPVVVSMSHDRCVAFLVAEQVERFGEC